MVWEAARRVAADLDLDPAWLNDAARAYAPGGRVEPLPVLDAPGIQVGVAPPELLLAMKLLAARPEQDRDDITTLYRVLGLTTAEQGIAVVTRAYPQARILPKTRFLLEEMFGPLSTAAADRPEL